MFFHRNEECSAAKRGVANAFAALVYIVLVAVVIRGIGWLLGSTEDGFMAPVAVLSLFVLSAAVMASLVFGKPAMLYVDGKKKDALRMLGWTIGSFAALTLCVFALMIALSRI